MSSRLSLAKRERETQQRAHIVQEQQQRNVGNLKEKSRFFQQKTQKKMKRNIACYWAHAIHHVILSPLCVDGSALACILCYTLLYLSLSLSPYKYTGGRRWLFVSANENRKCSISPVFSFLFHQKQRHNTGKKKNECCNEKHLASLFDGVDLSAICNDQRRF